MTGPDGNGFVILGLKNDCVKSLGCSNNSKDLLDEMTSGDYENLIQTFDKVWFSSNNVSLIIKN